MVMKTEGEDTDRVWNAEEIMVAGKIERTDLSFM